MAAAAAQEEAAASQTASTFGAPPTTQMVAVALPHSTHPVRFLIHRYLVLSTADSARLRVCGRCCVARARVRLLCVCVSVCVCVFCLSVCVCVCVKRGPRSTLRMSSTAPGGLRWRCAPPLVLRPSRLRLGCPYYATPSIPPKCPPAPVLSLTCPIPSATVSTCFVCFRRFSDTLFGH